MKSAMPLLDWNDYLKTGIDIVDQQHRALVNLANETAAKLSTGDHLSIDELRTLLGFLTDYAATHFSTEEALMALSGVEEQHVIHHRQSHASFLQQVETMVAELGGQGALSGHQLMDFLGNWLVYHMLGEDQELSRLLHSEAPDSVTGIPEGNPGNALRTQPAQEAASRSLSKLYSFTASRNQQLQATEQSQRTRSNEMMELVAEQSAQLAASEQRFRALFHNGVLPILITRLEENLMPGQLIDLSLTDIVAAEEIARFPLLISELLVTGKFECEMTHVTKSGRPVMTQMNMTQFVMNGQPVAISIIQDISTQRATALAQQDIQLQAKHLAQIRSDFLASMPSHPGKNTPAHLPASVADGKEVSQITLLLTAHPLFKDIAAADQALLASASRIRRLQKGDILFEKGDNPIGLILVVTGHVMLAVSPPQGGKKVLGIFGGQQSIGEAEVVMDSPYPYFAESVDDAEVIEVGQSALLALLDRDARFSRSFMKCIAARQHDLVHKMETYTLRTGAERVIGYLLQHARVDAGGQLEVSLPATKQLIASLLNIKPETLSRIFRDLSDASLIQVKGRDVHIPDADRLIAYQG